LARYVACMGEIIYLIKILAGKPEKIRPLGRPRRRCVDNIRMELRKMGEVGVDWMHLDQDRDQ